MIKHVKFVLELDQRLYIVDEIIYNNYDQNIFYYINKCIKRAHTHNRDHFWNKLKRIFVMTVGKTYIDTATNYFIRPGRNMKGNEK